MRGNFQRTKWGVTLLEMMLVITIMAAVFLALARYTAQQGDAARLDRAVLQINQITDAAIAFYVANGRWPDPCTVVTLDGTSNELQPNYLPGIAMHLPWAGTKTNYYQYYSCETGTSANNIPKFGTFQVSIDVGANANGVAFGKQLAGKLPLSSTALLDATNGTLIAYVQIPVIGNDSGLSNAQAFNYAGLYHHGACVPVPQCPPVMVGTTLTSTTATIFLLPVSISGANDNNSNNVYPISSYTAYAVGGTSGSPPSCDTGSIIPACAANTGTTTGNFWRACMQIVTEHGDMSATRTDAWGNNATMAAFVRCVPTGEASGSDLSTNTYSN